MSAKARVICACGRRIEARDVLQHGFFMSRWQPIWVYVKYRCSRCKMMGEKLVDYQSWDEDALAGDAVRPAGVETAPSPELGEIRDEEVRGFVAGIAELRPSDLDALARSLP